MSKAVSIAKEQVFAVIEAAMKKDGCGHAARSRAARFHRRTPGRPLHGDFATNAAMASARAFRMAPPKIAAAIMENLDLNGTYFVKAETAGPGFMNFFLGSAFYSDVLTEVLTKDSAYGRSDYGNHRKVMVEFVSANPTGPMHMGNARGGALGDCLASVLDAAGYDVWREFYVNDAGNQLDKFGLSLSIRYQQLFAENPPELPEDSYHGEDILDLAKEYAKEHGDELMHVTEEERRKALVGFGLPKNIAKMKADMEKYRVHYDRWFLESDLHKDGEVMAVVDYPATAASLTKKTALSGTRRPSSAAKKTKCSSAPTATRPTLRQTSPTTRISSTAVSTCSSTSGAAITMATSPA